MVGFYNYTVWMTYVALASGVAGIFSAFKGHPLVAVILSKCEWNFRFI